MSPRTRRSIAAPALSALTLLAFAGTAAAAPTPVLYGAAGGTGNGGGGNVPTLYRVDPATAQTTAVGPTGFSLTGLAVDPTTGVLYGATGANDPTAPRSIVTIDKATGAGTLVGPENAGPVADITFRPDGQLVGWSEANDRFVTIDKATGAATEVGAGTGSYGDGMSVDRDGRIFIMLRGNATNGGDLRTIDPVTGATTVVAPLSGAYNDGAAVPAAAFGCDRTTLYALDGLSGSAAPDYLSTVDTTTGAMTPIGETPVRMDGLEWDCPTEIGVSAGASTIGEAAGTVAVTINRLGGTKGATRVDWSTADGSAVAGQDYTATSGTVTFGDNEVTKTVTVPILNDSAFEGDESFRVNLSNPAPNATATPVTQTVTITDDDPAPPAVVPPTGPTAPTAVTPPTVSGDPIVGHRLTCVPGTFTGTSPATSVQWFVNGAPVAGATNLRYTVATGDIGKPIVCRITAANAAGSASSDSAGLVGRRVVAPRRASRITSAVTPARDATLPHRFVTTGRITRPTGVSRATGCSGKVRVTFTAGRFTISSRLVKVSSSCTYRSTVSFGVARRLRGTSSLAVRARFNGNAALLPSHASTKRVRVR
ncbi:Calx-beta domain-containing protein [Patulibacter sp.]|uniref:Calx-beta domain-containing protein n=1 Tax=Patulibacter sp. TaxID=1912859 RepID=UPI002726FC8C|nr:Calx-beta domain-containing protein [Patulibacter sp.]MDO9407113.1 Calx-beta domain-containing protein [Patulibacter sp.]